MHPRPPETTPEPVMDEDERAFRAAFARMVEWHRVEQSRALWRAFWPGALVLLPLGSSIVALAMAERLLPPHLQPAATVVGVLVTACGPLWAVAQLLHSIRRDLYVAIRVDGLAVRLDPTRPEQVYGWDDIEDARCADRRDPLVLSLRSGEQVTIASRFSELELHELGRRIRDARRLAVWNRLEPRFHYGDARE